MSQYTEKEIAKVAFAIINERPGIRTSELIDETRSQMNPTGDDLTILDGRNDDKFSQKVRNIKSHKSISDKVTTTDEHNCQWFPKR